jgi:hypothetical protein
MPSVLAAIFTPPPLLLGGRCGQLWMDDEHQSHWHLAGYIAAQSRG